MQLNDIKLYEKNVTMIQAIPQKLPNNSSCQNRLFSRDILFLHRHSKNNQGMYRQKLLVTY